MIWLGQLRRRLRLLSSRDQVERELTDELRHHIEMEAEELVTDGWTPENAKREALRRFGSEVRTQERVRDARGGGLLLNLVQDLGQALRSLRRSPGFAAVTVGTLGLAIGVNAGIFTVVERLLLDPLPFEDADRLVVLRGSAPGASELPEEFSLAEEFYLQFRESPLFESVSATIIRTDPVRVGDQTEVVWMSIASTNLFETLGAEPILGRIPQAEEAEEGTVVISHAFWTSRLGADPGVIGRSIGGEGGEMTVVGVMGSDFFFPMENTAVWAFYDPLPTDFAVDVIYAGLGREIVARMAPGVTRETVLRELPALAERIPERFGGSAEYARMVGQYRPVVRSLKDQVFGSADEALWILFAGVGLVLLIACVNLANLFTVRAEGRSREAAVRRALGAGRGRLIVTLFSEVVVIAALSGVLAVLLASVSIPLMLSAAPPNVPRMNGVELGLSTVSFAALASVLSALACGLLPALRSSSPDLARLRDGSRGSSRSLHWSRHGLVAAQTALALVLLIGSGLLMQSFRSLSRVDPGYDIEDVFTFQIAPSGDALFDGPSYARFHLDFMERLRALPGVEAVGIVNNVPLSEPASSGRYMRADQAGDPNAGAEFGYTFAAGDAFEALGIDLLEGRTLASDDHAPGVGNIVISESTADAMWPGERPLGRRIQSQTTGATYTVVGVVEDVLQDDLRGSPVPMVYLPMVGQMATSWSVASPGYVVKTERAAVIEPEIRELLRQVAPSAPMYRAGTMAAQAADSLVELSFTTIMLGILSMLALVLGSVGLYGILSYLVAERTHEIGVRMALGAEALRVQAMIVAQGARVVLLGVVVGLAIAVASTRALQGLLFGIEAADPATFLGMAAALVSIGLLASYLPARRAARVDPILSLRGD